MDAEKNFDDSDQTNTVESDDMDLHLLEADLAEVDHLRADDRHV